MKKGNIYTLIDSKVNTFTNTFGNVPVRITVIDDRVGMTAMVGVESVYPPSQMKGNCYAWNTKKTFRESYQPASEEIVAYIELGIL